MKRHVPLAFAFAALAACEAPTSAPAPREPTVAAPLLAVVVNDRFPFAFSVINPCNLEPFAGEGFVHLVIGQNSTPSGNNQFTFHVNVHGDGVGASGARYVAQQTVNQSVHQKDGGPIAVTITVQLLFIRQGSSATPDNFVVHQNVRLIFDPATGTVEIINENTKVECRG
jgi:hypothetical protein